MKFALRSVPAAGGNRFLLESLGKGDRMIRAGMTIENPITKSRTLILEAEAETQGNGWLLEVHCPPQAGPDIAEHLHLTWTETFEIVSGAAHYKLNGAQKTIQAGETVVMSPGQLQIHPWNAGDTPLIYRQRNHFGQPTPGAVGEVLGVFATVADLARAGKVDAAGRPKDPLQLAVTVKLLGKYGGYDASLPIPAQKFVAATLGTLANALGYRAVDPKYIDP